MEIYQEWMLIFWLLLYFTKPLKFSQQNSWSTIVTRHGSRTAVVPKSSKHSVTQRTNFTNEPVPELKHQLHKHTTQLKENESDWPFLRNFTLSSSDHQRTKEELMSESGEYYWPGSLKNSPTFFYTHVEPHRFEYRAMFQHSNNGFKPENFNPFVDDFPPFPKTRLPPFPNFPTFPALFEPKDQPEVPPFRFPTVPPSIRRILQPTVVDRAVQIPRPISHENLDGPFKKYDVVLGNLDTKYPKIFRFNEERMNIVDFEKQKKMKLKLGGVGGPNSISGAEHVPREQFLILHGGIFTVQEPPLYNQHSIRKRKLGRHFYASSNE